ncbi:MAG: glycosyltransferase family 1 protein [Nitrosomonadales bacterium]|nr:MAG: glycosyltransferase family 1 protein [Nitrosomonadales bacterium]
MARIAFIDVTATVTYGGIQTAIWQLAQAIHDLGHEVTIFGGEGDIRPDLGGRAITVHTFPFTPRERLPNFGSRFRKIAERFSFARHAKAAVVAGNFDWVILTKPLDFFWPWLMPRTGSHRFALMSGGTEFFAGDRILAKKINAWLACSHFNAWQIQSRYKKFPHVIYNGVNITQFECRPTDIELRAALGATSEDILFAYAGRLVGWKGMGVALRALAHPVMQGTPAKLMIIGAGPQLAELKQLASKLGITDRVLFHAAMPHSELPNMYAAMDVGIFPSIGDEAFGITIAEAMSCAKPVIASYIGGIPEVVGNEESCGLLTPPGDILALANAMKILACDADLRQRLGLGARARITRLYTWELSAKRLLVGLGLK